MLYFVLFLVRYLPFWAVPGALLFFDLGVYYYNARERGRTAAAFSMAAVCMILTGVWVFYDGYWRIGLLIRKNFG